MEENDAPPKLSVVGSSTWGPMHAPVVVTPPPMTTAEHFVHGLGRIICGFASPLERIGESLTERSARRVNALARQQLESLFGRPAATSSSTGVLGELDVRVIRASQQPPASSS